MGTRTTTLIAVGDNVTTRCRQQQCRHRHQVVGRPTTTASNDDKRESTKYLSQTVRRAGLPQWSDLPIAEIGSSGGDNAMYRLVDEMVARLARRPGAATQVVKEQRWLPRLAPLLPLAIPLPLARGFPGEGFAFPWSVYQWIKGEDVAAQPRLHLPDAAVRLGQFVAALQRVDPLEPRRRFEAVRSVSWTTVFAGRSRPECERPRQPRLGHGCVGDSTIGSVWRASRSGSMRTSTR